MAKQTQPDRWESPMLAAAMALTGTLVIFDKLHSLMHSYIFSWHLIPYCTSVLLVVAGLCLMVVQVTRPGAQTVVPNQRKKEGPHDR
jgi:protein-S-isoprenylcysteine O-methyltransferase Ste14